MEPIRSNVLGTRIYLNKGRKNSKGYFICHFLQKKNAEKIVQYFWPNKQIY